MMGSHLEQTLEWQTQNMDLSQTQMNKFIINRSA